MPAAGRPTSGFARQVRGLWSSRLLMQTFAPTQGRTLAARPALDLGRSSGSAIWPAPCRRGRRHPSAECSRPMRAWSPGRPSRRGPVRPSLPIATRLKEITGNDPPCSVALQGAAHVESEAGDLLSRVRLSARSDRNSILTCPKSSGNRRKGGHSCPFLRHKGPIFQSITKESSCVTSAMQRPRARSGARP